MCLVLNATLHCTLQTPPSHTTIYLVVHIRDLGLTLDLSLCSPLPHPWGLLCQLVLSLLPPLFGHKTYQTWLPRVGSWREGVSRPMQIFSPETELWVSISERREMNRSNTFYGHSLEKKWPLGLLKTEEMKSVVTYPESLPRNSFATWASQGHFLLFANRTEEQIQNNFNSLCTKSPSPGQFYSHSHCLDVSPDLVL